jgi:tryptophanase
VALAKMHAGFQSMAVVLMSVGGVAAFLTKESLGKPHLTSPHSRIAAATTALSLLNTLGVRLQ